MQKRVNRHFEIMFETGVDEMSWDDTVSKRVRWGEGDRRERVIRCRWKDSLAMNPPSSWCLGHHVLYNNTTQRVEDTNHGQCTS